MIAVEKLFKTLNKNNIKFFSGVPDSILKNFSFYLEKINNIQILLLRTRDQLLALVLGII